MKNALFSFICILTIFSCGDNAVSLDGEWVEVKKNDNVWKLQAEGNTLHGTRVSGTDTYSYETETWKVSKEDNNILLGKSTTADGSMITYFIDKNMILRTPPGRMYKRK